MKVGIIGYKGFVGSALFEEFSCDKRYETVGIERHGAKEIEEEKFWLLINANGNSSKRLADTDPSLDFEMNVQNTIRFLQEYPSEHYLHISTIEVYNKKDSKDLTTENTKIDPSVLSNYGFSKYLGELAAMRHAKSWLILRLGGMVGKNMKKGPAYDILHLKKLFISSKSEYQFISTADVAHIAKELAEKEKWGEIYNVVGEGSIKLSEFADTAGIMLTRVGSETQSFDISVEKVSRIIRPGKSAENVKRFLSSFIAKE